MQSLVAAQAVQAVQAVQHGAMYGCIVYCLGTFVGKKKKKQAWYTFTAWCTLTAWNTFTAWYTFTAAGNIFPSTVQSSEPSLFLWRYFHHSTMFWVSFVLDLCHVLQLNNNSRLSFCYVTHTHNNDYNGVLYLLSGSAGCTCLADYGSIYASMVFRTNDLRQVMFSWIMETAAGEHKGTAAMLLPLLLLLLLLLL